MSVLVGLKGEFRVPRAHACMCDDGGIMGLIPRSWNDTDEMDKYRTQRLQQWKDKNLPQNSSSHAASLSDAGHAESVHDRSVDITSESHDSDTEVDASTKGREGREVVSQA